MATQQKAGHGGTRKYGRNVAKCKLYRDHHIREKHKLKRVLRSNGYKAAVIYAQLHGLTAPKASE
jgi:hypothetical protein